MQDNSKAERIRTFTSSCLWYPAWSKNLSARDLMETTDPFSDARSAERAESVGGEQTMGYWSRLRNGRILQSAIRIFRRLSSGIWRFPKNGSCPDGACSNPGRFRLQAYFRSALYSLSTPSTGGSKQHRKPKFHRPLKFFAQLSFKKARPPSLCRSTASPIRFPAAPIYKKTCIFISAFMEKLVEK